MSRLHAFARASLLVGLALWPAACGGGEDPAERKAAAPEFELRDLLSDVRSRTAPVADPPPLGADDLEEVRGLCSLAASDANMLTVAREDVAHAQGRYGRADPGGARR